MNDHDLHDYAAAALWDAERGGQPAGDEAGVDDEWLWRLHAGFSLREWRRLLFLRWLYRQGRLTESL